MEASCGAEVLDEFREACVGRFIATVEAGVRGVEVRLDGGVEGGVDDLIEDHPHARGFLLFLGLNVIGGVGHLFAYLGEESGIGGFFSDGLSEGFKVGEEGLGVEFGVMGEGLAEGGEFFQRHGGLEVGGDEAGEEARMAPLFVELGSGVHGGEDGIEDLCGQIEGSLVGLGAIGVLAIGLVEGF